MHAQQRVARPISEVRLPSTLRPAASFRNSRTGYCPGDRSRDQRHWTPAKIERGDPRIKTQLTRLKIDVEQVIKGDAPNPLEFYYFTYSQENDISLGVPRYIPMVGNRRIYFLKLTDKGYRSVGDVTNYTLTIASGHQVHGFCDGKTPVCCLAELLLVPQPDFDNKWFAGSLIIGESVAETLCSRLAACLIWFVG